MELSKGKVAVLAVMLVGSAYYGITKYRSLTPNPSVNNGVTDDFRRGPRKEITPQRKQQFETQLGITPDQQKKLDALRSQGKSGNWRDRMSSMSAILTPEQRAKMQAMRTARMDSTAKKALPPGEFEAYKQKRDQMMQQWRQNRSRNSGKNGGGGPR
jgi:Spy/CpxP family protein refolding chaperone